MSFFGKKIGSGASINEVLTQEWNSKERKTYAIFKENIWAADLVEMGSLFS